MQEVNEKSFQKLMNYLDSFKIDATPTALSPDDYYVEFYFIKKVDQTSSDVTPTNTRDMVQPQAPKTSNTTQNNGSVEGVEASEEEDSGDSEVLEELRIAEVQHEQFSASNSVSSTQQKSLVEFGHVALRLRALTGAEDETTKEMILQQSLGELFARCGLDSTFNTSGFALSRTKYA